MTATTVRGRMDEPSGSTAAIVIDGARKSYGPTAVGRAEAVSDVSLRVERGSVHGLLGPNGAGKTTTLKMLLGLVRPSGGTFEICGLAADEPGARARLGFLPEQPYFPPLLKASEVLVMHGRLLGLEPAVIARRSDELLRKVGLEDAARTRLNRFSRGMLQRLGLAQALLGSPEVMVLDEPAGGLDPVGQRDVRNIILELRDQGVGVLLSSHQLSEVEAICDRVTIMNRGTVAAVGHIDDLLNSEGQTSIRARGEGELPSGVSDRVIESTVAGGIVTLSVAEADVRVTIDDLDDAGWRVLSVAPVRDSLEEYFSRMLEGSPLKGGDAS